MKPSHDDRFSSTQRRGLGQELWLFKIPSQAKSRHKPAPGPGLAQPGASGQGWHITSSAMGKEGLHLVLKAFDEDGVTKEDAHQAAEYYLKNYRFIYQNPDDNMVHCSSPSLFFC